MVEARQSRSEDLVSWQKAKWFLDDVSLARYSRHCLSKKMSLMRRTKLPEVSFVVSSIFIDLLQVGTIRRWLVYFRDVSETNSLWSSTRSSNVDLLYLIPLAWRRDDVTSMFDRRAKWEGQNKRLCYVCGLAKHHSRLLFVLISDLIFARQMRLRYCRVLSSARVRARIELMINGATKWIWIW